MKSLKTSEARPDLIGHFYFYIRLGITKIAVMRTAQTWAISSPHRFKHKKLVALFLKLHFYVVTRKIVVINDMHFIGFVHALCYKNAVTRLWWPQLLFLNNIVKLFKKLHLYLLINSCWNAQYEIQSKYMCLYTQKNDLLNQQKFGWPNKVFRLNMGQWKFCLN